MAVDESGSMKSDQYYAQMLKMMREQGAKDNPTTIQIGTMLSATSVKLDDLTLNAEDLYIADYLVSGYTRTIKIPYVSNVSLTVVSGEYDVKSVTVNQTKQSTITYTDGLKKDDLVAVQKLSNNKYAILARVVSV